MRVGINGMGRMGRLALRAAMGGVHRPADDPRRDGRLDVVHVNEIKGGAAATAHLLEFDSIHGRWHSSFEVDGGDACRLLGHHFPSACRRDTARPGGLTIDSPSIIRE